jgi:GxxExxY protein
MNANERESNELLLKDEVYRIVGAAMEVFNEVGHGLHEKPYENALVVEFGLQKISYSQQPRFPVVYKAVQIHEYVPDLIAESSVIVDTKVIERITDHERGQMLNGLRVLKPGLSSTSDEPNSNGSVLCSLTIRVDSRPFAVLSLLSP